ncbi:MAG: pyridoxamine 5'-phosphate oxidase family protein [Betaproteobacteria bacterium]
MEAPVAPGHAVGPEDKALRDMLWAELHRASRDRHHEWRTPVLATVGIDGLPQARTVVLREVDSAGGSLRVYTDRRSPKVVELGQTPAATLVFWSTRRNWQLRVRCLGTVDTSGPVAEATWARVKDAPSARDYLHPAAPGQALAAAPEPGASSADHHHHLAVITLEVLEMDWLELARTGHRRARVTAAGVSWLVP